MDIKSLLIEKDLQERLQILQEVEKNDSCVSTERLECLISISGTKAIIGPNLLSDIELLSSYSKSMSVVDSLPCTATKGGKRYLDTLLQVPICDTNLLKKRAKCIQIIAKDLREKEETQSILHKLVDNESSMLWVFDSDRDDLAQLYEMVYFTSWFTNPFNTNSRALTGYNLYRMIVSPAIGILTPIMYILVPYLIIRFKVGVSMSFFKYVKYTLSMLMSMDSMLLPPSLGKLKYLSYIFSIIFYCQGILNSIELAKAVYHICQIIVNKVSGFILYMHAASDLCKRYSIHIPKFYERFNGLKLDISLPHIDLAKPFSVFNNFGAILSLLKHLDKDIYVPIINASYSIDALIACAKLANKEGYTHPLYINSMASSESPSTTLRPYLHVNNVWHPSIPNPIKNDIFLGGPYSHTSNIIITGPNAGGKSTLIKSLLVSVVLAQTISVTCASEMSLVPFSYLSSQINIPDCKGKESLFEAEMYRSKQNLDTVKYLTPQQTGLIVMDEIFNSTNPIEGISGAFAILKHLSAYANVSCFITTHYLYLTKLAKELPDRFTNYRMEVKQDGLDISYPYKLSRGISRQYIALELLKKNGFDQGIIDDAIAIKKKLSTPVPKKEDETKECVENQKN